ncbi:hypothetical protein ACFY1U_15255 [Streptomyces sp. NPDC001351]|uniref:hypothetical protein n=1 Tax=Streptomyces sp. NPDC001351 TaxID=3364564 RepID=UPI00369BDB51
MVDKRGIAPQRIEAARALIAIADMIQAARHRRHLLQRDEREAGQAGTHIAGRHEVADAVPMHGDSARAPLNVIWNRCGAATSGT